MKLRLKCSLTFIVLQYIGFTIEVSLGVENEGCIFNVVFVVLKEIERQRRLKATY